MTQGNLHKLTFLLLAAYSNTGALLHAETKDSQVSNHSVETRKQPCNNTSTILAGLAQTFLELGKVTAATTEKEQQQAALNIVATALNVAAHLAHHRPRDEKNPPEKLSQEATKGIIDLTIALLHEREKQQHRSPEHELPETLDQINKTTTHEEKVSLIITLLSITNSAKQFFTDLLEELHYFIKDKIAPLGDSVKKILIYYLSPYAREDETQHDQDQEEKNELDIADETKSIRTYRCTTQEAEVLMSIKQLCSLSDAIKKH